MASSYFMLRFLKKKREMRRNQQQSASPVGKKINVNTCGWNSVTDIKCRICLKEGSVPIYGDKDDPHISVDIVTFGDITLSEEDGFPQYLCSSCHNLLQGAVLFRTMAKESDKILRQKTQNLDLQDNLASIESIHNSNEYDCNEEITKQQENQGKAYKCKLCNLQFQTLEEQVKHKNSKQHRKIRIKCPICHGLLTAKFYKNHLARHQSASHMVCDVCGKMYRKDNLIRHLQLHSFELPFQCQICPYRGRFMESLKIHMRTHSGDKPFACDKCQLRFLTRSNLNRHLLTHKKDRPFKCVECGRGFYTKRDMDIHFNSDHAGIKEFGCRMCGNKYGTKKALMRHELRVHKRDKMAKGRMPLYLQTEYRKQIDENLIEND